MNERERDAMLRLQRITGILVQNGISCPVTLDGETVVFDLDEPNIPYKESLVQAGATYDISRKKWIFWYEE